MIPKKIVVVIVCCIVGSIFTEVNAGSLIAYWKFDETSGSGSTASNSSGNGNIGSSWGLWPTHLNPIDIELKYGII